VGYYYQEGENKMTGRKVVCPYCGNSDKIAEKILQEVFDVYQWDEKEQRYIPLKQDQYGEAESLGMVCNFCDADLNSSWLELCGEDIESNPSEKKGE